MVSKPGYKYEYRKVLPLFTFDVFNSETTQFYSVQSCLDFGFHKYDSKLTYHSAKSSIVHKKFQG